MTFCRHQKIIPREHVLCTCGLQDFETTDDTTFVWSCWIFNGLNFLKNFHFANGKAKTCVRLVFCDSFQGAFQHLLQLIFTFIFQFSFALHIFFSLQPFKDPCNFYFCIFFYYLETVWLVDDVLVTCLNKGFSMDINNIFAKWCKQHN